MSAVKVFFSSSHHSLNNELQGWFQHTECNVLDISMDSNEYGHCLVLLYEPGSHRYEVQVFFASRHSGLESEANERLMQARHGGRQLVAVGSNAHGHCLCILLEV